MSEPVFKTQIDLDDSNITCTVPEKQKLREPTTDKNLTESHTTETVTDFVKEPSEDDAKNYTILKHHKEIMAKDEKTDLVTEDSKEDFVLTPVVTVTKEEVAFTKGDLKLQRVSVTEDISGTKTTTAIEDGTVIDDGKPEVRTEVISVQQIRKETQTTDKKQIENRKPKTRIPTLKFREAVNRLKQDRTNFEDKKEPEIRQQASPRSAIPKLKDIKTPAPLVSTPHKETIEALPRLSDEFDKLYEEIAEDQDSLDNLSISSKIDDPVKLDNTFEEIIHAYEENTIQSINIEKVRQSKIPLLKRRSEHEIELPTESSSLFKESVCGDLSKIKSVSLNKKPIRSTSIVKKIAEIKSEKKSFTDNVEKIMTVTVAAEEESNISMEPDVKIINNEEVKEELGLNKLPKINDNKENVTTTTHSTTSGEIETRRPILEHTNENIKSKIKNDIDNATIYNAKLVEKYEEQHISTQKEEKQFNTVTSAENNTEEVRKDSLNNFNTLEHVEKSNVKDILPENKNEEDILILKGKVNRIIERMDSQETDVKQSKKEFKSETPKEKSVMSKIAIFENSKPTDVTPAAKKPYNNQISYIKPPKYIESKRDSSYDRPKIIHELLKAIPVTSIDENNDNNINKMNTNNSNNNASTTKTDPKDKEYKMHIEIIDKQPQMAIQSIEPVEVKVHNTGENINAVINSNTQKLFINPHTATQIIPTDHEHIFNIQIIDVQPKVPVQSPQEDDAVFPLKGELKNIENKEPLPTDVEKIDLRPDLIEYEVKSIYNNQSHIDDNQNPNLNMNGSKRSNEELNTTPIFIETDVDSKAQSNTVQDNHYITASYEEYNVNKLITTHGRPEITPNIIKEEVKFERMNVDNKIRIKENEIFYKNTYKDQGQLRIHSYRNNAVDEKRKTNSVEILDYDVIFKGRVKNMIVRMKSLDRLDTEKKEIINIKERPRKKSVSEKIALFESKQIPIKLNKNELPKIAPKEIPQQSCLSEEEYAKVIEELSLAKTRYGVLDPGKMKYLELRDGGKMPAIGIGTASLDPKLTRYVVQTAIDLGYRTIDTAYIYGNEKEVGEAIHEKIKDGTVTRSELFIISKLWSTFHRQDLVHGACRASLDAMGLDYFDLYLIHNPMSFKEGGDPIPKIASVIQFSEHDYLDAWFGVEKLVQDGLVRRGGVSNFNSQQVDRVVEKGKIKPVINQVECHPYLSQHRLGDFCQARNVKLCCFGVLGSKGTPQEHKSALPPPIDDPLIRVMAAGLDVSPASLLISYQLALERSVIVKASSAAHLWDNLQALSFKPSAADVSALHALNRNKRIFTFKGYC